MHIYMGSRLFIIIFISGEKKKLMLQYTYIFSKSGSFLY